MSYKPYGFILVDETKESVSFLQKDLPNKHEILQKGDRLEFGMIVLHFSLLMSLSAKIKMYAMDVIYLYLNV